MQNILFISDNQNFITDLSDQILYHFSEYNVLSADSNEKADIIVVDEDKKALERELANKRNTPILFLTSDVENILELSSDIHIQSKPLLLSSFFDELQSCINRFDNSESGYLKFNKYEVHPMSKEILNLRNNEITKLTEKEVAIIKYLHKNKDRLISKNELLQEVWGYSPDVSTHTIETHIYRLRQKVEQDNPDAQLILTVEGGYQLKV